MKLSNHLAAVRREALEEAADSIDALMLECGRADPLPPGDIVTGMAYAAMRVRALIERRQARDVWLRAERATLEAVTNRSSPSEQKPTEAG